VLPDTGVMASKLCLVGAKGQLVLRGVLSTMLFCRHPRPTAREELI